jgi:Rod binding domain-containing protein
MIEVAPLAAGAAPSPRLAEARETAQKFEAVLIGQMAKIMLESAGDTGDFGGGHGEAMFRGVLAEHLGTQIARAGGIGLAPAVLDQILKLQGGSADAAREAFVGKDKTP